MRTRSSYEVQARMIGKPSAMSNVTVARVVVGAKAANADARWLRAHGWRVRVRSIPETR